MVIPVTFRLQNHASRTDGSAQGTVTFEKLRPRNGKFKVSASYHVGEWSGTVYDEEGYGFPGVNIGLAGTARAIVSDLDGSFKVKAGESEDLYLSFTGYESLRSGRR